jgi:hypothetical protein
VEVPKTFPRDETNPAGYEEDKKPVTDPVTKEQIEDARPLREAFGW